VISDGQPVQRENPSTSYRAKVGSRTLPVDGPKTASCMDGKLHDNGGGVNSASQASTRRMTYAERDQERIDAAEVVQKDGDIREHQSSH
jgi:hypothetical protein